MCLTVVDRGADEEALGAAAEVKQGVEIAVTQLHSEEVRPTFARPRHHQDGVTLESLEVELDAAATSRRPLRQAQVRPVTRLS